MHLDFDILIVGSGPSGVHAAQAALRGGAKTGLVDVGNRDEHYQNITPNRPWSELRRNDPDQHRYFLGEGDEDALSNTRSGAHLTPARQFITRGTEAHLPIESPQFDAVQSLAMGGLAAGWGAGCACYEDDELEKVGLAGSELRGFYEEVAEEVGISGSASDDISQHIVCVRNLQRPLDLDDNARAIFETYQSKQQKLIRRGFKLGRPMAAVLSETKDDRHPNPYHDMDFWSDHGQSVYRPVYTLRTLEGQPGFRYLCPWLVQSFKESTSGSIEIYARNLQTGEHTTLRTKRLLLAAGAINSARIALRSLSRYDTAVPLLSNPYTYVPAINLPLFGRSVSDRRHSLVQLSAIFQPGPAPEQRMVAQFYSYRSLLLHRLAREMPLPPALAMIFCRAIVTSLVLVGLNHPDCPNASRVMTLRRNRNGGDKLFIDYERSREEQKAIRGHELSLLKHLLTLRLAPLNVVRLPEGASIHYAGTLPFSEQNAPLTCTYEGRLAETDSVYLADGSPWRFLPAKGLTFTLMANARRIGARVAGELR